MVAVILTLFIVAGVIIGVILGHTFNKDTEE